MSRIIVDRIRLASPIRVDQFYHHQVLVINTTRLRYGKRITLHGLDGAPHINDLYTTLKKLFRLIGKMVPHARQRRRIRLVNMNTLNRAAHSEFSLRCTGRCTANSVIEDENTGCASSTASQSLRRLSFSKVTYTSLSNCSVSA
jgi:hypothetical protein